MGHKFSRDDNEPRYAVIVPLMGDGSVILEVRAAGISQAGDPCFPGGRIEAGELPLAAAVREMGEELGIAPSAILGTLPPVVTWRGHLAAVYVGTVSESDWAGIRLNPQEVARVFRFPLSHALARPASVEYRYDGERIWGMTALIIASLCRSGLWREGVGNL